VQPPRHQRGSRDAEENRGGANRREFAEGDQHGKRHRRGKQDNGRMPQPVRPRCKEGGGRGIVYRHRAPAFLPLEPFIGPG
jgi:hypothetical protein